MNTRLKNAAEIVLVATGLIVAGGVLLGVARLHLIGWILVGVGIALLPVAVLSLLTPWFRHVVRYLLGAPRLLLGPLRVCWLTLRHWNPFLWAGSPIRWRGFPGSRLERFSAPESGVTRASYFTANADWDVTEIVRGLVDDAGRLKFDVSNTVLGGDPEDGVVKDLRMDYVINGEMRTSAFREGDTVDLQVGR